MTFSDQMKHKADEVDLQGKAKALGDAVAEMLKTAVSLAAGYAENNRDKVEDILDKAEQAVATKAGGKHAATVTKVRASVDKGIDKLVEKEATRRTGVPADQHDAFPDH